MAIKVGPQGLSQTLTSGYGEGLTKKQKKALGFALDPGISDSQDGGGVVGDDIETIFGGNGTGNATPLSLKTTTSIVVTTSHKTHVSLADGVLGQVKRIIHTVRLSNADLVITPANFAAGTNITSDTQKRTVTLLYDGDNWQVIAGEITGTAEFVIA
tara:strand:+ start:743 stop:1213 length:471 start_codon:yes stop_codon:yes gene_type:complete